MKYHSEIPEELEREEMESVFNLNCFVTRAGADLKVSSAAEGGKKKSYIHIHKFQVFPFYMLI